MQKSVFPQPLTPVFQHTAHGLLFSKSDSSLFSLQKADMAVAPLTVTAERETAVDFTVALTATTTGMALRKDMVVDIDYLQFMTPLQIPVWIMVLVCQLVVTAGVFTLNYYSPYGYKDEGGRGTSSEFNLFNSLWLSLACMLQQGGDNTPKATSGGTFNSIIESSLILQIPALRLLYQTYDLEII